MVIKMKRYTNLKQTSNVTPYLGLELSHELEDEPLRVLLMLGVGEVELGVEVLVEPGGEVVPRL